MILAFPFLLYVEVYSDKMCIRDRITGEPHPITLYSPLWPVTKGRWGNISAADPIRAREVPEMCIRARHYAFASGIMNLGVMLPGMMSGYVSDWLGYKLFFIFVLLTRIAT